MNKNITLLKDKQSLKEMMLEALLKDNSAFSHTYEELSRESDYWWDNYLFSYTIGLNMILGYKEGEEICGIIGATFNNKTKSKHVGSIVWFYVKEKFRGKGIGKILLDEITELIRKQGHISKITLTVVSTQKQAIKMYEMQGFKISGRLKNELRNGDLFYDFITMEKFI